MPNHSPLAIANEFLSLRNQSVYPAQMQLQKLVYIAHGWNLAINHVPLVNEHPQAWDGGPVFRSIWNHIRDFGYGKHTGRLESPQTHQAFVAELNASERDVVRSVWERYGSYSGYELSQMTHAPDTPWFKAYFGRGQNTPLSNDDIEKHYTQLALAGRG